MHVRQAALPFDPTTLVAAVQLERGACCAFGALRKQTSRRSRCPSAATVTCETKEGATTMQRGAAASTLDGPAAVTDVKKGRKKKKGSTLV